MTLSITFLIFGVISLYYGAEWIVRGGSHLAARIGLSPLVIGLTIVAFGTSLPEMVVSLAAAAQESSSIAIGNVVGSNVANVGLVLGLSALIFPVSLTFSHIRYDLLFYLVAALIFTYFCLDGMINRWEGIILFSGIILYTGYCITHPHRRIDKNTSGKDSIIICSYYLLIGSISLYAGSKLFVEGAVSIAETLGISEVVIGMSIVALGTSLPELATSVMAAFHKESGISIGNIIGSNLFNILSVIGLVSILHPLQSPTEILYLEIPFMIAFGVVLFPIALLPQPISRLTSSLLVAGYTLFIFLLFY